MLLHIGETGHKADLDITVSRMFLGGGKGGCCFIKVHPYLSKVDIKEGTECYDKLSIHKLQVKEVATNAFMKVFQFFFFRSIQSCLLFFPPSLSPPLWSFPVLFFPFR